MNQEKVLEIFHRTKSLLDGHFELRSGLHSDRFFQCARVFEYPLIASDLCMAVVDVMRDELKCNVDVDTVISPALGGIQVGHEVARTLNTRFIFAEKENDRLVMRRGFKIRPGEKFVVAEDVVTRGGRVQETIEIVRSNGGIVQAVLVLVDRSGGKANLDVPMFSLIRMEPTTWTPDECPLCRKGEPMEHPGS